MSERTRAQLQEDVAALQAEVAALQRQLEIRPDVAGEVPGAPALDRLAAQAASDAILVIDTDSTVVFANPGVATVFGYAPDELVGRPLTILMPESLRALHRAAVRGYLDTGVRNVAWSGVELPGLRKDGARIRLEVSFGEFLREDRRYFVGIARDISARKHTEEVATALAEVGRDLARIEFAGAADRVAATVLRVFRGRRAILYRVDEETGGLVCVATAGENGVEHWLGRTLPPGAGVAGRAVVEGRAVWTEDVLADLGFDLPEWARERYRAEGYRVAAGVPLVARGQALGALVLCAEAQRAFTEDELKLLRVFADQAALALQNARLLAESDRRRRAAETVAEVMRLVSQSLDPQEVSQRIADAVLGLLGVRTSVVFLLDPPSGDLIALAVAGYSGRRFRRGMRFRRGAPVLARAVEERRPVSTPDRLADPAARLDHQVREAAEEAGYRAVLAVPLVVQDSVVGALQIGDREGRVFADEEVQLVQAFADQAALALKNSHLYEELAAALAAVQASQEQRVETERLRAISNLASGVAHHLNNLLMVILGRVQLVMPQVQASGVHQALERVERTTLDAAEAIRRLQAFAQVQAVAAAVPIDLNQMVRDAVEAARPRWQEDGRARGVRVDVAFLEGEIPPVAGEPPALREVFTNLVLNAAEAMPEGGTITVRTWAAEQSVYCAVADSGVGMSPEVCRRAFEPFFTTKGVQSLGLGLSVAYGIVHRHDGDLGIESVEGEGTVVTVRLPVQVMRREAGSAPSLRGSR